MLTINRSLNVYSAGMPQIINLSKYDTDFQLVFDLYTSNGTLTLPSGTTAKIQGTKTDGNGYEASATISGNTVTVNGHVQMTACEGDNIYEIVLLHNNKRLSTLNFILRVEDAAMDEGTITSETVLKDLSNLHEAVEEAEEAAQTATEAVRKVTIDATLTQQGQSADAKAAGDRIRLSEDYLKLLCDEIPNTVQTYAFTDGAVSSVTHKAGTATVRTDAFSYTDTAITEVRTLATGKSLTIVTNLDTLETTVTYAA